MKKIRIENCRTKVRCIKPQQFSIPKTVQTNALNFSQRISAIFIILTITLLLLVNTISALVINGTDASSNTYTSDSAQGGVVEKHVLNADYSYNSSIFSWGGPIANATNAADLSVSELGVSDVSEIYVVTIGPDITDTIPDSAPAEVPPVIETSSAIPSSGGSGGGSSSHDTYGLIVGDIVTIIINNEPHTITITDIGEDSAVLTLDDNQIIELSINEEKYIDFNNDGTDEITITLDSVSELRKITITVFDLTRQEIPEEPPIKEQEQPVALERITTAVSAVDIQKVEEVTKEISKTTGTIVTYIVGLNVLMGILLGSMYSVKKIKQRRIYAVFHAQSSEEVVKQELAKLQLYVSGAMETGKSVALIKQELLETGWQEYETDSIMVDAMLKEQENLNRIL